MKNNEIQKQKESLSSLACRAVSAAWRQPTPLKPPEVDPDLPFLPLTQRVAEVLRFNLLDLEYALSSGGGLREYLKFNLRIGAFLLIPAVILGTAMTVIFAYVYSLSALLLATLINVLLSLLVLMLIAGIIISIPFIIKSVATKK